MPLAAPLPAQKKAPQLRGLSVFFPDPVDRCQLRPDAGKYRCEKSPLFAPRRVASSRTQFLSGWNVGASIPRPNLKARVFVHAFRRSGQPANGVAAATRARVDAPSFFPYSLPPFGLAFDRCLSASRITRVAERLHCSLSKPNASAWIPHENRYLRQVCVKTLGKSVQSPDIPFM
jgi:hypothetical protein